MTIKDPAKETTTKWKVHRNPTEREETPSSKSKTNK